MFYLIIFSWSFYLKYLKAFFPVGGEGVVGGELSYCERAGFLFDNIA